MIIAALLICLLVLSCATIGLLLFSGAAETVVNGLILLAAGVICFIGAIWAAAMSALYLVDAIFQ